jgi:hypothetical protein
MKKNAIYVTGWVLIAITGAAGLGVSHLCESRFSHTTHELIAALGQLLPLVGLFLLASLREEKNRIDNP